MKAKPIQRFNRYTIGLSDLEKAQVLKYLAGDISSREAGKTLGYSHQGAINFILQVCRQLFQKGELVIKRQK